MTKNQIGSIIKKKANVSRETLKGEIMEMSEILQAISTVGFPIVMCLIMMWYIKDTTANHKEETAQFTEALNKNTLVLQHLADTISQKEE